MLNRTPTHTDREFESELVHLRQRLLRMSGRVEQMINQSAKALVMGDVELARATVLLDRAVNSDEMEIDELGMRLLARWQPMASDLRFIIFAFKIVTDLERIGDLAVNICERAIQLGNEAGVEPFNDIPEMAKGVAWMLSESIDAFVHRDEGRARAVIERDDEIDDAYHRIFRAQVERMTVDHDHFDRCLAVQNVGKYLERMADHATNIAEQVIFLVRGQDVRHAGKRISNER